MMRPLAWATGGLVPISALAIATSGLISRDSYMSDYHAALSIAADTHARMGQGAEPVRVRLEVAE